MSEIKKALEDLIKTAKTGDLVRITLGLAAFSLLVSSQEFSEADKFGILAELEAAFHRNFVEGN